MGRRPFGALRVNSLMPKGNGERPAGTGVPALQQTATAGGGGKILRCAQDDGGGRRRAEGFGSRTTEATKLSDGRGKPLPNRLAFDMRRR